MNHNFQKTSSKLETTTQKSTEPRRKLIGAIKPDRPLNTSSIASNNILASGPKSILLSTVDLDATPLFTLCSQLSQHRAYASPFGSKFGSKYDKRRLKID